MKLGAHLSIAKGWRALVVRAVDLGCETVQVFSRSPRGGKPRPLNGPEMKSFRSLCKEANISPLCVHVPYFVNLGAEKDDTWEYSVSTLQLDLERARDLGAAFVVTHLGRYKKDREEALARSVAALRVVLEAELPDVKLLLEVSSGQGRELGSTLEELAYVARHADPDGRLGFCLDTAHLHAAGYDIVSESGLERFVENVEDTLGLESLELVHLNDAVYPRGSKRDRHAGIGEGTIGREGFRRFINHPCLSHLPGVLETPASGDEDHRRNLVILRELTKKPDG